MHPVLLRIGSYPLHTFGVLLSLGFILGTLYFLRLSRRSGEAPQRMVDLAFWIFISALIGSRILFVIVNLPEYLRHPLDIFKVWRGGLVYYGGFIGAFLTGAWYLKRHGLHVWRVGDIALTSVMLGLSIGRWGCLMAADDFGKVTELPWAIKIPNLIGYPEFENLPLHPTQIYMSMNAFIIFLIAHFLINPRKKYHGQTTFLVALLYAVGRSFIEIFRGDYKRGFIAEWDILPPVGPDFLSTSQFISIFIVLISIVMLFLLKKRPMTKGVKGATTSIKGSKRSKK